MKRYVKYIILAAVALLCIAFVLIPSTGISSLMAIMAFPFDQIGAVLRFLSLSGFAGNITSVVFYIVICLLPCLLFLRKSKKYYFEDCLIILKSAVLFIVIYLMINPSYIPLAKGLAETLPVTKAILGGTVYSIILGYFVLRALRLFNKSDTKKLISYVSILLYVLNIMFVAIICISYFGGCVGAIKAMQQNNSANQQLYAINFIFIVLKFIIESLPYTFNIAITFAAIKLLQNLNTHNAEKVSEICCYSLIAVTLSNIFINIAQLLFAQNLFNVNAVVQFPLFSVIFVLACLLFAKIIKENTALKAENDSFI